MTNKQPFLEILTAAFSTGEVKSYALVGGYFELIDCPYAVTVRLIGINGELKGIMRNAEASFYIRDSDFQTIEIESPQAQIIRFAFGSSEAGTRRTAGVVSVVDGGRARTQANQAFSMAAYQAPAGAGNNSHCQLWNPVGSGVSVVISNVSFSAATAGALTMAVTNVQQPTNISATRHQSKLSGGALAAAQVRTGAPAGVPAIAFQLFQINANLTLFNRFTEPVVLTPGYGLTIAHNTANTDLLFNAEWYEERI